MTLFVLYPFLTLHMDALGLDEWEIGINQATAPIVAILGPPVAGLIADKIGNFKVVLSFITLVNAAVALLLLLVPVARETITLPANLTFEIGCDSSSSLFNIKSLDPYECSLKSSQLSTFPEHILVQCGQMCRTVEGSEVESLDAFPEFPLSINSNFSIKLKNTSYTFHAIFGTRPKFICSADDECKLASSYDTSTGSDLEFNSQDVIREFSKISFSKLELENFIESNSGVNDTFNVTEPSFRIQGPIVLDSEVHNNPTCSPISMQVDEMSVCENKCFLQMSRKAVCANDTVRKVYNVGLSFGLYTLFRLMLGFASATSFIMFEGAVLAILKQYGGDYGLQRVSATFAAIIAAPISGLLLQNYSFRPVFYLYAGLQAFSAFLTLKIDLKFKKPSENVIGHLKEVLSQLEILIFFAAMLCSGTAWGYLETFLFLFLKKLGGSQTLMGLTITVGGLFGLPFLIFSRPIIKKLGHVNVLCLGLLFYGIRYFGYSFIENPWLCLPFEALESITASLAITAAATYAVALSTLQTIASVQGMMGALYFGIGRGAGSFLGGLSIKKFGHRETFQIFGLGSFVACLLYTLTNILYLRRHSKASSGLDINNMNGLVISNGSAKLKQDNAKEQFQMKPANQDSELGYGKVNPGFEDVDGGGEDNNKFTDIPLDEDNPSTTHHNNNN
ncbi:Major facilitator superfamily domain-containing protein 6-B [Orchesella cincta]|uniref:Major facilitator superfamily domain-containing protein 6-B n=1 Tax=Orchesella cincta TaxID=48709 RepID=A0A1D2N9G9_ORCCI|nr:Major facilitator superfamily domain-containing protein 6-B [Orchesella cincta]